MDIEAEARHVQEFVDKGNYHAAYNIALSGLNACRRSNDQAGIDRFINIIRAVVDSLAAEFGSRSDEDV
jgi:hypothetical protein